MHGTGLANKPHKLLLLSFVLISINIKPVVLVVGLSIIMLISTS